jgi:type IV pilus assembly protein PilQ
MTEERAMRASPTSTRPGPGARRTRPGSTLRVALGLAVAALLAAGPGRAAGPNALLGIDVQPNGAGRVVRIRTESTPTFTVFRLSDPMRVVVDVSGADASRVESPIGVEDGVLGQIAVRQFSADGFHIARVTVGFEQETGYEVFAEGNAVVVKAGEGSVVSSVAPPPVAPADRAAAERLETVRAQVDEAARRAAGERKAADEAASVARRQQEEARVVAADADRKAAAAAAAKTDAERLRKQAQDAANKDRAAAQVALGQAEERLRLAEESSRKVASERAEAERVAANARRAQSEAEQAAAEAEAKAKKQRAELEERIARAQKEQKAAVDAQARAARAKLEAEQAQRAADDARVAAERVRDETKKKLDDIAGREAGINAERRSLAVDRQRLESDRQALATREKELTATAERERKKAEDDKLAAEHARKKAEDDKVAAERARKKAEDDKLAAERARQKAEDDRLAAERARKKAEDDKLGAEQERRRAEEAARLATAKNLDSARLAAERAPQPTRVASTQGSGTSAGSAPVLLASAAVTAATSTASARPALRTVPADPTPTAAPAEKPLRCSGVKASNGRILINLDGEPDFDVQRLDGPARLVVDVAATTRATRKTTWEVRLPWAQRVRLGDHGGTLRAVIDLASAEIEPQVTAGPEGLIIVPPAKASAPRTPPAEAVAARATPTTHGAGGPIDPETDPTGDGGPPAAVKAPAAPPVAAPAAALARVKDVRFERKGQKARVVVELDGTPTALVDDRSSKTWVLQLRDTRVPKELERSLDTVAYETAVKMVSIYQASESPLIANVVVTLNSAAGQHLGQQGQTLVWEIESEAPRAVTTSAAPQTAAFATEATAVAQATPRETVAQKRVNMRLKDADLVNVIRFIADVTGENIIVSEEVKGKVTVNLRNVPWEQALDTILRSRGYDKVRANNIIRIATAEQIQKEREREVAKKKSLVETGETVVRMISVSYATAKELVDQVKPSLSPRGTIQVDERTNTIIVEDLRDNINRIVELTRRLDRQTPQVLIEARIVEASSNFVQELGIQWGGVGQAASQYGNPTGLKFPSDVIASGAADDSQTVTNGTISPGRFAVNLPAAVGSNAGGAIGFIFGSAGGGQLLSLRLSALESNGSGRIISSPRIATLDNRTARIAQGTDIPISTVSAAGTNTRFIPANLELEVTPHVTNDGTVSLKLKTAKNEPDFTRRGAQGDPTIVKKSAETEIMVRDGDTAVIGGIYTRNTSENYAEVPFFSKIPVLGWLFKKRRTEDSRAELLIFITPRIINRDTALSGDGGGAITPGGAPPGPPPTEPQQSEPGAPPPGRESGPTPR